MDGFSVRRRKFSSREKSDSDLLKASRSASDEASSKFVATGIARRVSTSHSVPVFKDNEAIDGKSSVEQIEEELKKEEERIDSSDVDTQGFETLSSLNVLFIFGAVVTLALVFVCNTFVFVAFTSRSNDVEGALATVSVVSDASFASLMLRNGLGGEACEMARQAEVAYKALVLGEKVVTVNFTVPRDVLDDMLKQKLRKVASSVGQLRACLCVNQLAPDAKPSRPPSRRVAARNVVEELEKPFETDTLHCSDSALFRHTHRIRESFTVAREAAKRAAQSGSSKLLFTLGGATLLVAAAVLIQTFLLFRPTLARVDKSFSQITALQKEKVAESQREMQTISAILSFAQVALRDLRSWPLVRATSAQLRKLMSAKRCSVYLQNGQEWNCAKDFETRKNWSGFPTELSVISLSSFIVSSQTAELEHLSAANDDPSARHRLKAMWTVHSALEGSINTEADPPLGFACARVDLGGGANAVIALELEREITSKDRVRFALGMGVARSVFRAALSRASAERARSHLAAVLQSISQTVITFDKHGRFSGINRKIGKVAKTVLRDEKMLEGDTKASFEDILRQSVVTDAVAALYEGKAEETRGEYLHSGVRSMSGGGIDADCSLQYCATPLLKYSTSSSSESDSDRPMPNSSSAEESNFLSLRRRSSGGARLAGAVLVLEDITEQRQLRSALSTYLSPELVEYVLKDQASALSGVCRRITTLFGDIKGFTSQMDRAQTPKLQREFVARLNRHFGKMHDAVVEQKGVLDKFLGDAAMATFGSVKQSEMDAVHAIECALRMVEDCQEFEIGVGINTGDAICGNIGCAARFDFTCIGQCVNIAARLEPLTRYYDVSVVITEPTLHELGRHADRFIIRELDRIRVKGCSSPITIFEVCGRSSMANADKIRERNRAFVEALQLYRSAKFQEAKSAFAILDKKYNDAPCKVFVLRCDDLAQKPASPKWDAVFNFFQK